MDTKNVFYRRNEGREETLFVQKALKMAESKALAMFLNLFVPPLYIMAWIANMDNIKSTILFIAALLFGMIRTYFWMIRARQNNRMRDLEILEKEIELRSKNSQS